jgi:hypothetical protein
MIMTTTKRAAATAFTTPTDREIVISRVFDAPRRLVVEAYTNPEHVPHWFDPRGATLPVCEIDRPRPCPNRTCLGTAPAVSERDMAAEGGLNAAGRTS